jgi:hypothetical protein
VVVAADAERDLGDWSAGIWNVVAPRTVGHPRRTARRR